ncbi:MAG: hypothetical protein AAGA80_02795 [Cyanobacteria bacterium P01_F01_bin.143]
MFDIVIAFLIRDRLWEMRSSVEERSPSTREEIFLKLAKSQYKQRKLHFFALNL